MDLLYSSGNSAQYSVCPIWEKKLKKKIKICVCITESLCCTPKTQHCKSSVFPYKIKTNLKMIMHHEVSLD